MAFAETEKYGLYSALGLLRGFAIQLSYRWALGTVVASPGDRAVLLWSPVGHRRASRGVPRVCLAAAAGVATGVSLFLLSNLLLLTPLGFLLHALGISRNTVRDVTVAVVAFRLLMTFARACRAYVHDTRLLACLPPSENHRWRLDYVAAFPAGACYGTRLLQQFLRLADDQDAEITLHCDPDLVPYYRRQGFRRIESATDGQVLMLRQARSARRGSPRPSAKLPVAVG